MSFWTTLRSSPLRPTKCRNEPNNASGPAVRARTLHGDLMATSKHIPAELLEQLRRDRDEIAAELPEMIERGRRLEEAAAENSLCGHLRGAIHRSGRPLKKVAADVGLDVFVLCDFLEGTRTLRSDVLDRLAQAVMATIRVEPTRPQRLQSPTDGKRAPRRGRKGGGTKRRKQQA